MSSVYPTSIVAFTTKTNKVDLVDASHINSLQDEVVAIETELGKIIKGTQANLKERLAVCLGGDGSIAHSPSFRAGPITGQVHYRTDLGVLYVWTGSAWDPVVPGPSNLFSAYKSANQSVSHVGDTTPTKITFDTEDFDTGGNFASSTYTAPATGKYIFTVGFQYDVTTGSSNTQENIAIYKNGSQFAVIGGFNTNSATTSGGASGSIIMSLAASDTIEIYLVPIAVGAATDIIGGSTQARFTGARIS